MKVGLVLDDTLDSTDGVQQYVLLVGEWLRAKGHDVHYLVGSSKRSDIKNVHSLSRNVQVKFNKNKLSIPYKVHGKKIKEVIDDSWDVIHVQMPYSPQLAGKVIKQINSNTALVGTFHIAPYSKTVTGSTRALRFFTAKTLKRFDKVLSVSQVAKVFAKKTLKVDSEVVPNAIEIKKWPKSKNKDIDVLFLGRLVERKGCMLFVKAIHELSITKDISNLNIVIAGDGQKRTELEKYVSDNNLNSNIKFLGFVSEAKKRELMAKSRISVFPSKGGESFGIVLLEAMAAGSLALGGDNPGYRSVIGSIEESLFALDPKQIAKKLDKFLTGKAQYQQTFKAQQVLVANFDIEKVGSDILAVYKQAHKARKGSK